MCKKSKCCCIQTTKGIPGPPGLNGITMIKFLNGNTGPQGPIGITGTQGPIGLTGPQGPIGMTGTQGPIGMTGTQGPIGLTGVTGTQGPIGMTGTQGPIGLTGPQGPIGMTGTQGPIGLTGPQGPIGMTGIQGPIGMTGTQGSIGPSGGINGVSEFFAIMPNDNSSNIMPGGFVNFPQDGISTNSIVTRLTSNSFNISNIGIYLVYFQASITEPGQLVLTLNGIPLMRTLVGRNSGNSQITSQNIIQISSANTILQVQNPSGNHVSLTLTSKAGGTNPVSANIIIMLI